KISPRQKTLLIRVAQRFAVRFISHPPPPLCAWLLAIAASNVTVSRRCWIIWVGNPNIELRHNKVRVPGLAVGVGRMTAPGVTMDDNLRKAWRDRNYHIWNNS